MAPSLRDLIDFLLAEIALCGTQGASPAEILSFIDAFYAKCAKDGSNRAPVVDRRFQEKVWQWLVQNPEVSVGKDREGNGLSLEQAERRQQATNAAEEEPISVFVSLERTWLAITGHEPDDTKVLPMEFALLSIIASRKSSGIFQPDLIKISGQDKRSVPKRTDVLQQKGYIEKRAVQLKGARTSLCTLRKFLSQDARKLAADTSENGANAVKMIDFNSFTDTLFGILREHKIISRNDLKRVLGFNDHWHWKVLSRALRKFERIGVVKRVKAMSQYAKTMKKYHPCVMLVREPTAKDIELFHDFSVHMYSDIKQSDEAEFEDDAEAEDAIGEASAAGDIRPMEGEQDVEASGRVLPLWSPDRIIHNQLFDVVDRAGIMGSTNSDVIRTFSGVLWRRPLENTLARLSECWQLSQPPHLRHLALVRDTALQRTITHYIHYSARNFSKLVEAGESSWEAVEFVPRNNRSNTVSIPPVHAKPQLDAYGLPQDVPASDLVKNGDCSLFDCMWIVKPKDYNISSSDPKAVELDDGIYTIRYGIKGRSIPSPAGSQATPDTSSRLKLERERASSIGTDVAATPVHKRPRKTKREPQNFAGMSELEKLKAMGFDETWTEYSVLLIDRPGPGVYVTPRGRRRPAGKERGRPPASRIVVFKSPKLMDLAWFLTDNEGSDITRPASQSRELLTVDQSSLAAAAQGSAQPSKVDETGVANGTKRPYQQDSGEERDTLSSKASKLRRTGDISNGLGSSQVPIADVVMADGKTAETHAQQPQTPSRDQGKRKRTLSPDIEYQNGVRVRKRGGRVERSLQSSPMAEGHGPRPSRKSTGREASKASKHPLAARGDNESRLEQHLHSARNENISAVPHTAAGSATNQTTALETTQLEDSIPLLTGSGTANEVSLTASTPVPARLQSNTPGALQTETPTSSATPPPVTSSRRATRSKLVDKGGSVAFLRRRIVMDLVEKAGGAFPMGSELWYPFVTAWMKTKYKEKPDMRTLRNAVKYLVDAGKLRQQTFCGKDSKGVMVTKTIICKAELAPDDRIIKEMQEQILTSDARHYFPAGVDVDPNLTKQGTGPKLVRGVDIPVETNLTVQLHNKPALVQALEKRKGATIQRRLNRCLEIEQMRESMQEVRPSGVIRLLSRPRPDWYIPPVSGTAPLFGDDPSFGALRKHTTRRHRLFTSQTVGNGKLKRINFTLSLLAPYAMLMSPTQSFNQLNGTFSTDAGLSTFTLARAPQSRAKQVIMTRATLMLMNTYQTFNSSNGTFSTNAGLAGLLMSRSISRSSQYRSTRKQDVHLPHSLDDQLMQAGRRNIRLPGETDSRSRDFIRDTNAILRWELQNERLLQERSEDVHYINHGIRDSFQSAPIEGGIRFHAEEMDFIHEEPAVGTQMRAGSSPPFIFEEHPDFPPPPPRNTMRMRHYNPPPPPRPRRLEKLNEIMASGNESASPSASRTQLRRNRLPLPFSRSSYQKLMTAIVAVRALAGGANGNIVDWPLVSCCFPEQDSKVVQDKGKIFLAKNRLQIAKMQYDFQERFVEAYANNEVPPIDYNNLEGYDWNAVIEWANANLDVPRSDQTPDLPATREQFDDIFELREEPLSSLDELYQTTTAVTLNRKKQLISNIAFAVPLPAKASNHRSHRRLELSRFETVKTCVRANVFTPAEVYRPADARDTLSRIDNSLLNNALQSLVTERVISQANKGRVVPGRNYDITDYFIQTLSKKRPIEATEVRRASKFKTEVLDPALTQRGVFSVAFNAEDGDILALINLFSEGRIKLAPCDPPRDKFGLTEGGYLTRMMNKDKLRFPVHVYPVAGKYVTGNPVSEKASSTPPPCSPRIPIPTDSTGTATEMGAVSLPEKFPLWIDIHGGFIQVLWDLALGAILGTVAVRPGISAKRLASAIKPTMGDWEVLMVLEWLVAVGVVRKSGGHGAGADDETNEACWYVREWWWMVL
ncbi:hypothetical protein BDW66DRAFT_137204, partial [Aspergillus desertorum]